MYAQLLILTVDTMGGVYQRLGGGAKPPHDDFIRG